MALIILKFFDCRRFKDFWISQSINFPGTKSNFRNFAIAQITQVVNFVLCLSGMKIAI